MQKYEFTWALVKYIENDQWKMKIGTNWYSLYDGLNEMGEGGWQLAGIQLREIPYGGTQANLFSPSYVYVFQRPAEKH